MTDQMTWIARVYLHLLVERAAANPDPPEDVQLTNEALQYARKALNGEVPPPFEPTPKIPALPPGEYARVEIMGHDQVTGWVTDGTRAGVPVLVIRDWDGRVLREVPGQSLYQFVPLPTPLKRPDPVAALPGPASGWKNLAGLDDDPWAGQDDESNPF